MDEKILDTATLRSTLYSLRAPTTIGIGNSTSLRLVCISDTHGKHLQLADKIPDGDILIHAGDFTNKLRRSDMQESLQEFNSFLGTLPHKHKIVIGGNHEIAFNDFSTNEIQRMLSNCTYLQDSATIVEGLKIYGTPWTNSVGMGFSCRGKNLHKHWELIPFDVDILVSHLPPSGVLDLAYDFSADDRGACTQCGAVHRKYVHWGDQSLRSRVRSIKPIAHIFGHVHNSHGYLKQEGTLFINAAQDETMQPIFFDCLPVTAVLATPGLVRRNSWPVDLNTGVSKSVPFQLEFQDPRKSELVSIKDFSFKRPRFLTEEWVCGSQRNHHPLSEQEEDVHTWLPCLGNVQEDSLYSNETSAEFLAESSNTFFHWKRQKQNITTLANESSWCRRFSEQNVGPDCSNYRDHVLVSKS